MCYNFFEFKFLIDFLNYIFDYIGEDFDEIFIKDIDEIFLIVIFFIKG